MNLLVSFNDIFSPTFFNLCCDNSIMELFYNINNCGQIDSKDFIDVIVVEGLRINHISKLNVTILTDIIDDGLHEFLLLGVQRVSA